jgi:DNA-binding NarL/FixJ family response regulator
MEILPKNRLPGSDDRKGSPGSIPQVAEADTPQVQDAPGEFVSYDESMTRVFIADALPEERSALRLVLMDLGMEVIGEAASWEPTLAQAPSLRPDMLLIDWSMLPQATQSIALASLRTACPGALVIVLISHLDARQQAALSSGADTFISKGETPERVAERLRSVAAAIRPI